MKDFKEVVMFAGTYISVCIGSGFATGQEIMQFFSVHGLQSILPALLCMIILGYCGARLLEIGKTVKLKSSNDIFIYLCGKHIGNIFKIIMPIFFFLSFIVMVSGAGASLNQYYGVNSLIGSFLLVILVLASIILGMNKIIDILGNIGPAIIVTSIGVGLVTITRNYDMILESNEIIKSLDMTVAVDNIWLTGIIYSGLNLIIVTPFLISVGKTARNKKNCILGGVIGGVVFMIAAIVLNIAILSDIENIYTTQIPTLYMSKSIGPVVGVMFSIILLAGIYTTAVPLLWNVCTSFAKEGTYKFYFIAVVCSIAALIMSKLPFSALVNMIYPISGIIGIFIIIGILLSKTIRKIN